MGARTHVVDEDVHGLLAHLGDELRRVVLAARLLDAALEVPAERLLAPRAVDRVGDGREGRGGAVLPRATELRVEVERERAVPAHGVPKDRLAREVLQAAVAHQRRCDKRPRLRDSRWGGRRPG